MELNQEEINKIITLFSYLGIPEEKIAVELVEDEIKITVDVDEQDAGIYIGRYATTIDSIQLLIALMLNSYEDKRRVTLDIGGYRQRRISTLESMVERISADVLSSGTAHALPPISSTERRQVHMMFSSHDKLTTYSQGDGRDRRLFIALKDN